MPRYVLGSDLPEALQREARERDHRRYTGEYRPAWLDHPTTDTARRNGPPDFEDDAAWLAHTEFPVSGQGRTLHLARNRQANRTHFPSKRPAPKGYPVDLFARWDPPAVTKAKRPDYMLGSALPPHLQHQAKWTKAGMARYTREHRPAWVDRPQLNGPVPLMWDSDADWLAHVEFPVVGAGDKLRLHRGAHPARPTPTYPDNPELRRTDDDGASSAAKQPINPNLAIVLARAVADHAGVPYWVKVEGYPVGELTPIMPAGADWMWRKVMPDGQVLPLR